MAGKVKVDINLKRAADYSLDRIARGVRAAALTAEGELIDILSVPPVRTGRIYSRTGGKTHQASAPGEAPAPDTGDLRQSVASLPIERRARSVRAKVGTSSDHAEHTELGTEKMAPRPHTSRLATDRERRDAITDAFKKGAKS